MAGWFDENAPDQQDWFSANAPIPTLDTQVVTPSEGGGLDLQRMKAGLPPGREFPEAPASGMAPYIVGATEAVVPQSLSDLVHMAILPRAEPIDVERENQLGAEWRGEYGPEAQARSITGTAMAGLPLLHLPFSESPLRPTPADISLVDQINLAQAQAAQPPPIPPEYAERRFTMQDTPPEPQSQLASPPGPETGNLAEAIQEQQARSRDWEQRNEADRQQQNINAMAAQLYNDALKEAKGPGPRDIAAESLLSMQKRVAQVTTGDRDVLAAFDRAHQMATQLAEARHGSLLSPDRPTRYIDYTKLPDVAPASAVEAPAPQPAAVGEEAPISPAAAPVEPGTEAVINAPSALPKKQIDDLIPFNIQGNKTKLLANSIGGLVENAARTSRRIIDAFAGSGTYTHYIRERGLGKSGDILNEFDPLRAITHKQIRDNPAAVGAAVDRYRNELRGMIDVEPGDPWSPKADAVREKVNAYFRRKFAEFIKPGQNLRELTRTGEPVEMVDSPDLAGLYTLAQNQAFSFLPIQAELARSARYFGTLKQPGFGVVGPYAGRVQILKNFQPKTMNAASIINAAGERFKGLDVRRGDGWKLIREKAGEGDFVPVDTSYLNKELNPDTSNYNEATMEDALPDVWLRKVSENLLPAWDRGAKLLVTNNYDSVVAQQLRELGFQVNTAYRSRGVPELVATNFDHATGEVYPRRMAVLRNVSEAINRPIELRGGEAVSTGGAERLAPRSQSENAAVSGRGPAVTDAGARVAPEAPLPPIGTPLKGVALYGEPGRTAADVAAAAQPLPVPQEGATLPPNGAEVGIPRGDERYAGVTPQAGATQPVGGNVAGFEQVYGAGEVPAGPTLTPEDAWDAAKLRTQLGQSNPYGFVDRAKTGAITPAEMGDLIYEHHRLVERAAGLEGTPEYEGAYQAASTFANNVLKPAQNAWHQKGMAMQIARPVDFSTETGMRDAMDRMNVELKANQASEANRIVRENAKAKADVNGAEDKLMKAMDKEYSRGAKQVPKTAEQLRAQLAETEPCAL